MDHEPEKPKDQPSNSPDSHESTLEVCPFPDEALEKVLSFIDSHKDRSSVSLVRKDWYNAERWTRSKLFIGNCYSVSPEIVAQRFPRIKSVTLKGKPRFSDFNLLPHDWGANVHPWIVMFAKVYPFLEELRLKRMNMTDESLELLANSFPGFKALSLTSCEGFTENGLKAVASHCRYLTELDIQDSMTVEVSGEWLSCFPENFSSLEILNFASLSGEVSFDDLDRLVARCKSLRVLKVNEAVSLDQLQRLLVHAPGLEVLGTGSFTQELSTRQCEEIENAFHNCKNLQVLSGLWEANPLYLPLIYGACGGLTFLDLTNAPIESAEFEKLLSHCPNLRRLWVVDTVRDKGLEAVGPSCPVLEELRVLPSDPYDQYNGEGVSESGLVAVSRGCPRLRYLLYFCRRMTNAAVVLAARSCPGFTHFRLCIMTPRQPDYLTGLPMDEAFATVAKTCPGLKRLSVSGLLTDQTFEYIGKYAKNLETLSVAFADGSDWGMQCVVNGCMNLRKLEIRDSEFGNAGLLAGCERYGSMRSLWMSGCRVTRKGCQLLAGANVGLNVEMIMDDYEMVHMNKVYVYRSVVGPRKDAPPFVLTLGQGEGERRK